MTLNLTAYSQRAVRPSMFTTTSLELACDQHRFPCPIKRTFLNFQNARGHDRDLIFGMFKLQVHTSPVSSACIRPRLNRRFSLTLVPGKIPDVQWVWICRALLGVRSCRNTPPSTSDCTMLRFTSSLRCECGEKSCGQIATLLGAYYECGTLARIQGTLYLSCRPI